LNKIVFFLLFNFIITSCSTPEQIRNSRATLGTVKNTSEVQRYLLAELPYWANFSTISACHRNVSIKYMNYNNLKKSFNLNYSQATHLQHMFNKKVYAYKSSIAGHDTPRNLRNVQDESFIFYNVYEQVMAGSFDFKVPQFPKVSIVWIDSILNDKKLIKEIFKRNDVLNGFPIMMSQCLSYFELEALSQELDIENLGVKFISSEMFTHYDKALNASTNFQLQLDKILVDKEIYFYAQDEPTNVFGITKFIKLK
jgi:hypothetical protein